MGWIEEAVYELVQQSTLDGATANATMRVQFLATGICSLLYVYVLVVDYGKATIQATLEKRNIDSWFNWMGLATYLLLMFCISNYSSIASFVAGGVDRMNMSTQMGTKEYEQMNEIMSLNLKQQMTAQRELSNEQLGYEFGRLMIKKEAALGDTEMMTPKDIAELEAIQEEIGRRARESEDANDLKRDIKEGYGEAFDDREDEIESYYANRHNGGWQDTIELIGYYFSNPGILVLRIINLIIGFFIMGIKVVVIFMSLYMFKVLLVFGPFVFALGIIPAFRSNIGSYFGAVISAGLVIMTINVLDQMMWEVSVKYVSKMSFKDMSSVDVGEVVVGLSFNFAMLVMYFSCFWITGKFVSGGAGMGAMMGKAGMAVGMVGAAAMLPAKAAAKAASGGKAGGSISGKGMSKQAGDGFSG